MEAELQTVEHDLDVLVALLVAVVYLVINSLGSAAPRVLGGPIVVAERVEDVLALLRVVVLHFVGSGGTIAALGLLDLSFAPVGMRRCWC